MSMERHPGWTQGRWRREESLSPDHRMSGSFWPWLAIATARRNQRRAFADNRRARLRAKRARRSVLSIRFGKKLWRDEKYWEIRRSKRWPA